MSPTAWARPAARFLAVLALVIAPADAQMRPFVLEEATVSSIHAALAARQITCVQLVQKYLDRIAAFDRQGPSLGAILTLNSRALALAADMDRAAASAAPLKPLQCIP